MKELKTLEDMKNFVISQQMFEVARGDTITGNFVNRNELREEAIKHYHQSDGNKHKFIMKFFNLTEDDLKQ